MRNCMSKSRLFVTILASIAIVLSIQASAYAQEIPSSCTGEYESKAYNAGVTGGLSIVEMAWKSINDCERIELFEDIVVDIVDRMTVPEDASQTVVCRYVGYINGIFEQTDEIYESCASQRK